MADRSAALAISPDSRLLVSAGDDGKIPFWEASNGRELKTLSAEPPHDAMVAPWHSARMVRRWLRPGRSTGWPSGIRRPGWSATSFPAEGPVGAEGHRVHP